LLAALEDVMNRMAAWAFHLGTQMGHVPSAGVERAPFLSARFASGFLTTMRPYLLFVSGITGLLGMAMAPAVPDRAAAVLGFVFFLTYGFGQALTDCFQMDTDALSSPYRPHVQGAIRRAHVFALSLSGLLVCGWILVAFHPLNLVLAGVEIGGLLTYTWMKRRWWGGPPHNAWIVAGLVVMGFAAAHGAAGARIVLDVRLAWAAAAAFLGYGTFVISGYHKDVEADRATGYRTLPVRFGRRVSAWTSDAFAAGAVACTAVLVAIAPSLGEAAGIPALAFLAAAAVAFLVAERRLHRSTNDDDAHRAIAPVVHAYILAMGGGVAAHHPDWAPFVTGFYLAFVLALGVRPMREQI
jgi:4-hydroxybenzoate polyprenyltransferase